MTCKNCIHEGVCRSAGYICRDEYGDAILYSDSEKVEVDCEDFTDKSRFIEPPCKIGQTLYRVAKHRGVWEVLPREVISMTYYLDCFGSAKWSLFTTVDDKLGKTVFLTEAEARAAIEERANK